MGPMMLQGSRFLLASVLVGIYTWKDIRASSRHSVKAGVILGFLLGSGFALQTIGLVETTASKAGFLTGTMVIFTPMFQMLIERRLPSLGNTLGVIIVGFGLYLFTSPEGGAFNKGDLLVLLCAIVFALYIVYLDVFTKARFDREIVFYQFAVTSAMGFLLAPFFDPIPAYFSTQGFLAIAYLAVFASCLAIFVQSKYQRETTPTRAAIIFTMEPIFAAILAVIWLHEILSGTALIGAAIMIAGLLVSELIGARKKAKASSD